MIQIFRKTDCQNDTRLRHSDRNQPLAHNLHFLKRKPKQTLRLREKVTNV